MTKLELKWNADPEIIKGLTKKLMEDGDLDTKGITVAGQNYSARELIQEIYKGTPVGKRFYHLHKEVIKTLWQLYIQEPEVPEACTKALQQVSEESKHKEVLKFLEYH